MSGVFGAQLMFGAPVWMIVAVLGLVALSALTRAFFFLTDRPIHLPQWVMRGFKYAPVAALAAIIAPEIVLPGVGGLAGPLDPKWIAAPVAAIWAWLRKDMLGTILVGMTAYLAIKFGLGW